MKSREVYRSARERNISHWRTTAHRTSLSEEFINPKAFRKNSKFQKIWKTFENLRNYFKNSSKIFSKKKLRQKSFQVSKNNLASTTWLGAALKIGCLMGHLDEFYEKCEFGPWFRPNKLLIISDPSSMGH